MVTKSKYNKKELNNLISKLSGDTLLSIQINDILSNNLNKKEIIEICEWMNYLLKVNERKVK